MSVQRKETLYLLDFGDFIKIGHSSSLRQRMNTLTGKIKQDFILETSVVWIFDRSASLFLETSMIQKYADYRYNHELIKNEAFLPECKEKIMNDISNVIEVLELKGSFHTMDELLEHRPGKRDAYGYHHTDYVLQITAGYRRVDPFGIVN